MHLAYQLIIIVPNKQCAYYAEYKKNVNRLAKKSFS